MISLQCRETMLGNWEESDAILWHHREVTGRRPGEQVLKKSCPGFKPGLLRQKAVTLPLERPPGLKVCKIERRDT